MKCKTIIFTLFGVLLLAPLSFGVEKKSADSPAPSVFIPEDAYDFKKVVDGTQVVHEFIIQNKGDAPLKINKVKTG